MPPKEVAVSPPTVDPTIATSFIPNKVRYLGHCALTAGLTIPGMYEP